MEIPQLDNRFVQAVSDDLKKKLVRRIEVVPAYTIDENIQQFNDMGVARAINKTN
jgi:hypothetical protein